MDADKAEPDETNCLKDESGGEDAPPDEPIQGPAGLRWLKYAGIGPARSAKTNYSAKPASALSGEAITSLGSLEAEVMAAVWDIGHPATSMQVMEHSLYKRRAQGEQPIAFATISTTLRRLAQKGLLATQKNDQRTPTYAPTVGREEMAARVLNNVSETLLGRSLYALLPRLTGGRPPADRQASKKAGRGASSSPEPSSVEDVAVNDLLHALETLAEAEGRDDVEEA